MYSVSLSPDQIRLFGLMSILSDSDHPTHRKPCDQSAIPSSRLQINTKLDEIINESTYEFPFELIDLISDYLFSTRCFTGSSRGELLEWNFNDEEILLLNQSKNIEIRSLKSHQQNTAISGIIASADEKHVFTSGFDGVLRIHRLDDHGDWVVERELLTQQHGIWCLKAGAIHNPMLIMAESDSASTQPAYLPVVAAGLVNNSILVFNLFSGFQLYNLLGHRGKVSAIEFASHQRLLSGSWDCRVRVWNIGLQCTEFIGIGHAANVNAICKLTENLFASADQDGKILIFNIPTRSQIEIQPPVSQTVAEIAETRIPSEFSFKAEEFFQTSPIPPPSSEAPRPVEELTPIIAIAAAHSAAVNCLLFMPDIPINNKADEISGFLISGSRDETIKLWKIYIGNDQSKQIKTGPGVYSSSIESSTSPQFISVSEFHTVSATRSVLSFRLFSSRRLAVGCSGGEIQIWNLSPANWNPNRIEIDKKIQAHTNGVRAIEIQEFLTP